MTPAFDIQTLIRPHLRDLKPYSSARDEYTGTTGIFLDANENPLGSATQEAYNRYPDPLQRALKPELAQVKGVRAEQIFLGNGSDEAIDLLFRAFCEPGVDHVITMPPTYGMYRVSAQINAVEIREVPLTPSFELDTEQVLAAIRKETKLIWLCSPNNPTGNCLDRGGMEEILRNTLGLVVVDEAYADFAPEQSLLPLLDEYPNLVVLQTFSKAWGLAGLRLGMAFAQEEVIHILNSIKPPYNVNGLTQKLGLEAVQNREAKQQMVAEILSERRRLSEALAHLPFILKVHPSEANFILVKVENPDEMYAQLIQRKIIVRNRSKVLHCEGCLRFSVGTREENDQLLNTLLALYG